MGLDGMAPIAVMLYAVTIATPSLFQWWLWSHAWRAKLFSPVVDIGMYRHVRRNLVPVPILFYTSIVVCAIWGSVPALLSWFAIIPISIVVGRWRPRGQRTVHSQHQE